MTVGGGCCAYCLIYSYIIYVSCFCYMACKDLICEQIEEWKNNVDINGFDRYERIEQSLSIIEEDSDESDIFEEDNAVIVIKNENLLIKETPKNGLPKWTIS